ncbi:hypothetical protein G6F46_007873 [Rhizopus delemar]|uniref:Uncharacterized protein n=3 Tax=Rhizopus TaxID=4842 RepID=I1CKS2_RHIO9|nr:hypothetical protein RO3G_13763 [Rhizopus delemar RA 99-880]KAG1052272.1 hypothetical protein G6F43_005581 [Rhizopus delemar]KAG1546305.1 hypothetical protein G6F51_004957 [Rhizopus arrhizus]KAG1458325.1 hypothetical protein G6F55_005414 [Rhizopus delemar]KAG1497236.1 hypothetical protein G6F54_005900 [Rhizopus delemar]|eukprot:EIE89052.1 hypothetical protein RO3G_13763 [Rhizopus delemar RA 99-880]
MKKVQFSGEVEFVSTFANEDYDRTAQEVAKLTYRDMLELLTMKSQWKRDLEKRMAERDLKESETNQVNTAPYNVPEICT